MPGPIPSEHSIETNDRRPKAVGDNRLSTPPKWLSNNAKKIFRETAKEIKKLGISDKADTNVLAIFAMQYDRLTSLSANNDGELPSQRLLNDLSTQCLSLIKELGLSPSSRAKLRITKVESQDELDKFFGDE